MDDNKLTRRIVRKLQIVSTIRWGGEEQCPAQAAMIFFSIALAKTDTSATRGEAPRTA